jgi:hypothetical protein
VLITNYVLHEMRPQAAKAKLLLRYSFFCKDDLGRKNYELSQRNLKYKEFLKEIYIYFFNDISKAQTRNLHILGLCSNNYMFRLPI